MKTALILPTAIGISSDEGRIQQFVNGFKQIAELVNKYPEFEVYVVDSTISDESKIDLRIIDSIHSISTLQEKVFFFDNELGKKNKGAGLIVQWKEVLKRVNTKKYEYMISFEPRQKLVDASFFERFSKDPQAYCKVSTVKIKKFKLIPRVIDQILTGLVCFKWKSVESYVESVDLVRMVARKISIEDDLFLFLNNKKIPFVRVEKLGILWHDMVNDQYIEL